MHLHEINCPHTQLIQLLIQYWKNTINKVELKSSWPGIRAIMTLQYIRLGIITLCYHSLLVISRIPQPGINKHLGVHRTFTFRVSSRVILDLILQQHWCLSKKNKQLNLKLHFSAVLALKDDSWVQCCCKHKSERAETDSALDICLHLCNNGLTAQFIVFFSELTPAVSDREQSCGRTKA